MNSALLRNRKGLRPALLSLLPLLLLLLCYCAGQDGLGQLFVSIGAAPGAFALDCFLFAAAFFLILGLCGRVWVAWLVGLLPLVLNLISHFKLLINGAPLALSDLSLAAHFGEIMGFAGPQLRFTFGVIAPSLAYLLILFLLVWQRPFFSVDKRFRLIGGGAGLAALLLLFLLPLPASLYAPVNADPGPHETALRFYASVRADRLIAAPVDPALLEKISTDAVEAAVAADDLTPEEAPTPAEETEPAPVEVPEEPEAEAPPTVIFLMSESFFDLSRLPGVAFGEDPQPFFHSLQEHFPHGRFYSNTYAGGTGFVETEVLTGLCSAFLRGSDNLTSLPDERYAALPCVSDVFEASGYRKTFVHSYNDSLYNRRWIYSAFGFDALYFEEDFPPEAERKGERLSDMALSEELIRLYEAGKGEGPQMFYAVSMENHQPYTPGLYGEENDLALESELLTEEARETLRTYAYAARDVDAALERLTSYFEGVDERIMLVFWGDHMPNLTVSDGTIYEKLGMIHSSATTEWTTEELSEMLSTNYVIWTNYEPELPAAERAESCTFLGLHVLRRLGLPLSDYFLWLEARVEPACLLYRPRFFADRQGGFYTEVPPDCAAEIEEFSAVVRDIVYGEGSVFSHHRETGT